MTKCPPGLAIGINRFNSPFSAMNVAEARRDWNERRAIEAIKAGTLLTSR